MLLFAALVLADCLPVGVSVLTCVAADSVALHKLKKLLLNKRILADVGKLSHDHQASSLERFHRLVCHFAPKNVAFPFVGVLCR